MGVVKCPVSLPGHMDTSADVMVLSQPPSATASTSKEDGGEAEAEAVAVACSSPSATSLDDLEEFSSRLSDIISAYGNACGQVRGTTAGRCCF